MRNRCCNIPGHAGSQFEKRRATRSCDTCLSGSAAQPNLHLCPSPLPNKQGVTGGVCSMNSFLEQFFPSVCAAATAIK